MPGTADYDLGYCYIEARTDATQQSGQTPDKEVEIKNITVYVSGYAEPDTTGMLSPPTVWPFSVAVDTNSNVFDFYFLIWSLSRLLCCVGSGSNVAAALGYCYIEARTDTTQQSGQTPDKEVAIKNITVNVSGYSEIDTTGMLSPPTVWRFSVAADINRNVSDFCFLI